MASVSSPLNLAHQHAANADDYIAQGLLIPAAEEHYKAAEAFLVCVQASTDEHTKRTLRMLYSDHSKAGKELQRRIAKLREENKDPTLPQKQLSATPSTTSVAQAVAPLPPTPPSPPPNAQQEMAESHTIEESFMVLGQRNDSTDPFNQFWKITEGMLEYLSQPVAFATAPLTPSSRRRDPSSSSDTDIDDPISRGLSRGIGLVKAARSRMLTRHDSLAGPSEYDAGRAGITTFPPKLQVDVRDDWDEEVRADDDDDLADSFCLIPSKADASTAAMLKKENDMLRAELEGVRKQLASADGMLKMRQEQDQQLRDSILLARKEAQRAMLSSTAVPRPVQPPLDLASLNLNAPPIPVPVPPITPGTAGRDREAQLVRRVRELEEEVRGLHTENDKQKVMIVRFRERWEKLKESAKKKKEAKAAVQATNVVSQRIDEEPEAEAEAERNDADL